MAETGERLALEVSTPEGKALSLQVSSVQVPGAQGELGILVQHRPLLAALRPGVLRYAEAGRTHAAAIGAGYVEVGPDRIRLLTDRFAAPETIERETVEQELAATEVRIKGFGGPATGQQFEELEHDLAWAHARLEALKTLQD